MQGWQRWLGLGAAAGVICALIPGARLPGALPSPQAELEQLHSPLGKLSEAPPPPPAEPDFSGLDLLRIELHQDRVTSPLPNEQTAELTLEPGLQRAALGVMKRYALP